MRPEYLVLKPDELHRFGSTATAVFDMYVFELIRFRCNAESRRGTYDRGGSVWWRASVEELCGELGGVSVRPVRVALDRLVDGGLLEREKHSEQGPTDRAWSYRPVCQRRQLPCDIPSKSENRSNDGPKTVDDLQVSGDGTLFGRSDIPDKPSIYRNNLKRNACETPDDDRFEEFWCAYPRKDGKSGSKVAYGKAIKGGAAADDLFQASKAYAEDVVRRGTDRQFVRKAYNWLRDGDWESFTSAGAVEASDSAVDALVAELGVSGAAERLGVAYNVPERIFEIEEPEARKRAVAEFSSEWLGRNRQRLAERLAG